MVEGTSSVGSIDGLYKSIVDLDENYFISEEVKEMLVNSRIAPQFSISNQLLPIFESQAPEYYFHGAYGSSHLVSTYVCRSSDVKGQSCELLEFEDPNTLMKMDL